MATKRAPKGKWLAHPIKAGSETERAKRHGRSLHEQEVMDSHSPDKRIRGKGVFGLNAARGAFKHRTTKRRSRSRA